MLVTKRCFFANYPMDVAYIGLDVRRVPLAEKQAAQTSRKLQNSELAREVSNFRFVSGAGGKCRVYPPE